MIYIKDINSQNALRWFWVILKILKITTQQSGYQPLSHLKLTQINDIVYR